MNKRPRLTCNDCYFRQFELCALEVAEPCPTFRLHDRGSLMAPKQAPLVPRALEPVSPVRFLPRPQAA